jgi:glutathione S-transferase
MGTGARSAEGDGGMYQLYWMERSGAFAPAAVMAELDIPYEGIRLDRHRLESADFRARYPMAQVPVLILPDGSSMTESGAISLYLAETQPESGLAPAPGEPIRPRFLHWLSFAQVNLYETVLRYFYAQRYTSDPAGAPGVQQAAGERLDRLWAMTAGAIQGPFFFGDRYTLLDIYFAMLSAWHIDPPALHRRLPNVGALAAATIARPAVGKVWADYGMHERTA